MMLVFPFVLIVLSAIAITIGVAIQSSKTIYEKVKEFIDSMF